MAKSVMLTRVEAQLLVDILEDNYVKNRFQPAGSGADLASEIRDIFGMVDQPELIQDGENEQ